MAGLRAAAPPPRQPGRTGVVLVVGKGHEQYQEIQGVRHPFQDQQILRAELAKWVDRNREWLARLVRLSRPDGLPVGLQLVARRRADWPLLSIAAAFEAATGYAQTAPSLPA